MPHTKLQEAAQCNTLEVVYITLQGEEGAQEANHEPNPWFWPISEWMSKRTIHVPSWTVLKSNKNKSLAGNVMTVTICNDGKGGQSGLCQVSVIHQKKKKLSTPSVNTVSQKVQFVEWKQDVKVVGYWFVWKWQTLPRPVSNRTGHARKLHLCGYKRKDQKRLHLCKCQTRHSLRRTRGQNGDGIPGLWSCCSSIMNNGM